MKREQTFEPVDRIRIGVATPEQAHDAVARLADNGADFIKIRTAQDAETLQAVSDAARGRGLLLTGHPLASPDKLLTMGFASVEHLVATSSDAIGASAEERAALFARYPLSLSQTMSSQELLYWLLQNHLCYAMT